MNEIIQNFQFIRPQWLLLFVPILLGYAIKLKYGKDQNLWQQIIPKHLYQQMIVSKGMHKTNRFMHVAMLGLLTATLAIAGPSWEKLPQAVYQTQVGKVILMDMSMSLRATDLSPNRLTRARFKAIDLVNEVKEGETGLVAYAGDAFVVSPLTDDINNLKTLIPVLSPEIMPAQGSSALMGLEQAATLLINAGYKEGQIYWITDGISYDEINGVRDFIINSGFDISALLIGTEAGAPIAMQDGQLLKDFSGKIVVPSINSRYMNQAMAGTSAQYHLFATDNSDIQAIKMKIEFEQQKQAEAVENTTGDELKDMGPYLVLVLLPVAAYAFRKGMLNIAIATLLTSLIVLPNQTAMAQSQALDTSPSTTPDIAQAKANSPAETLIDKVFNNPNQRGKLAFDNSDFEKAGGLFESDEWRAASAYKMGDYESAAALYSELLKNDDTNNTSNLYNHGNSLAKLGKLEEALDAYNKTLSKDSEHKQASQNKKIVEDLLQQQENEQNQQEDSNDSSDPNSDEQKQDSDEQQKGESDSKQEEKSDGSDNESQENGQEGEENGDQQDSEQQGDQQSEQEQNNASDEALKDNAQKQAEQESQSDEQQEQDASQNDKANQETDGEEASEQEQQAAISKQINADDLTPEQKEEMQRMQMILNKVPDDPAYLLKRKMLLEAYKRKSNPPPPEQENW